MSRTRSRGRRRPRSRRLEGGPAALRADDLAAADPGIRATPAVFYGRAAHVAGTRESQAGRHRQLTLCRAAVAAYGGQETAGYLGEDCRADHPLNATGVSGHEPKAHGSGASARRRPAMSAGSCVAPSWRKTAV